MSRGALAPTVPAHFVYLTPQNLGSGLLSKCCVRFGMTAVQPWHLVPFAPQLRLGLNCTVITRASHPARNAAVARQRRGCRRRMRGRAHASPGANARAKPSSPRIPRGDELQLKGIDLATPRTSASPRAARDVDDEDASIAGPVAVGRCVALACVTSGWARAARAAGIAAAAQKQSSGRVAAPHSLQRGRVSSTPGRRSHGRR